MKNHLQKEVQNSGGKAVNFHLMGHLTETESGTAISDPTMETTQI